MRQARRQSASGKAGLVFPVGRIRRHLRTRYASRVGAGAPVYLAAVLEYLAAEVLNAAGNMTRREQKRRIIPRYIHLGIYDDEELDRLLSNVVVANSGVKPQIHSHLLVQRSR